ncbi:MAG: hypothetical protein M3P04_12025 [Actinomycetota bacterium]|nr:hypothetical protein [Actinomycetota bacterium]
MRLRRYGGPARRGGLLGLLALALAACGTTVPMSSSTGAPGQGAVDGGLTAPGVVTPGGTLSQPSVGSPTSSGSTTGALAGPSSGSASLAPGGGSAPALPATGRGYDAKHVYLGFPTNNDVNQAAGALGLGALDFGDQDAIIDAVVADLNARGGLLGRSVVAVKHDLKTADLQTDPSKMAEETCAALTEDRPVVAVVNVVAAIDVKTFYGCLARHATPVVSAGFTVVDDPFLAEFAPHLTKLTASSFTYLTPLWLERLVALRYFTPWNTLSGAPGTPPVKVGLLYPSVQPQQRIFADVHKRLVARGFTVVPDVQYTTASLDAEGAAMSNAVLSFNSQGVTHVLSSDSDVLLFMQAADKQQYRPRYGLTSYHAPAAALQAIVPASQLVGALGVGWLPVSDVDSAHSPGSVGPGEKACRATMSKHSVAISEAGARIIAFAECDGVALLASTITSAKAFAATALRQATGVVGPSFSSALVWSSALSSTRADLPGSARDLGFDGTAFRYLSATNRAF